MDELNEALTNGGQFTVSNPCGYAGADHLERRVTRLLSNQVYTQA
jgi:hypothetical protein